MIVPQREIDAIRRERMRRRMMRLPVKRREDGSLIPAPVREGRAYRLRAHREALKVTVTVTGVRRERIAAISDADARREGFYSIADALVAWGQRFGEPGLEQLVWVVSFVCGDETEYMQQDQPIFLSKYGDYTTLSRRQAIPGDPELTIIPGEGERARVTALAQRTEPHRQVVSRATEDMGALRRSLTGMKARNRAKLIERELAKLAAELPPEQQLDCA